MTREQLEHAIRAACDVSEDDEVYVFGSQAILGEHPEAPSSLLVSIEADIAPKNHPERWNDIDGSIGERSAFHERHGFYVQGVTLETATLPPGWEQRCVRVRNPNTRWHTGWCLEGHDLALSKRAAWRDKDRSFVRPYSAPRGSRASRRTSHTAAEDGPRAAPERPDRRVDRSDRRRASCHRFLKGPRAGPPQRTKTNT